MAIIHNKGSNFRQESNIATSHTHEWKLRNWIGQNTWHHWKAKSMGEQQLVLELEQHQQDLDQRGGLLVHQPAYPPEQNIIKHNHISQHKNQLKVQNRKRKDTKNTHSRHS